MFFDSVCPTRPSDTVTKYKIYPTILLMERIYKWSWVLFCNFILWLAKPGSKMPCILLFETEYSLEFVYTNLPFFIPSSRHQDSNSHYLVFATAKIPKIWKRTSLDVYFSIWKSQDRFINHQWIIQPKLIDCPSDTFFQFRNSPCNWR